MRSHFKAVLSLLFLIVFVSGGNKPSVAEEFFERMGDFVVHVNFRRNFKIKSTAKVYFKPSPSKRDLLGRDINALNSIMRNIVSTYLILVEERDADYLLQVGVAKMIDYSIRNAERVPSQAFVMFSICHIKIVQIKEDCQNTTFYAFDYKDDSDLLTKGYQLWLKRVVERHDR